jgi:hypothetical protein
MIHGESKIKRPEPVFNGPEDIRRFSVSAGQRLEEQALDVSLSAVQIRSALALVPDGSMGISSAIRARLVVWHLKATAKFLDSAAGYAAGTYQSFLRRFEKEMGK